MDTSLVAGTLSMVANNGVGFAKFLNRLDFVSNYYISVTDSIADQIAPYSAAGALQLSAALFPVATIAPPPVKSISRRSASRTFLRRKRRTKRRLYSDDSEGGEVNGFGGGDFDGSYGGGGGSGGSGWNFDRFGGSDWDESSSSSSNPAYYFVYEVVYWIALSNCVHFAFKKVIRFAGEAIRNSERGKLSMRLISVC
ncbi:uncharacterized protein LOC111778252 [Cucurbita pepo subsp. pepo]|uniref:uncharacterized protein LOC111778252 n=1 Tax=Cucurbita pepo subsp. pepo TaxID=3664 RepID=UPI000C9D819D|nr:uncharacterized protein LOC111778252 [Cucurbita pepo subsp. pepo]